MSFSVRALAAVVIAPSFLAVPVADADELRERILDSKYTRGDYGIYAGWHDPADWQFDEHGAYAVPVGVKVRLRWLEWLRVEADVFYYRKSANRPVQVSVFKGPSFDCFSVGASLQWVPLQSGRVRPYVGGGPIFVSLGNDFVAFRPDVYRASPGSPDQFVLASWGEFDIGWSLTGGLDFPVGRRAFPFVEFRALFGEVAFGPRDIQLGSSSLGGVDLEVSDLETVPNDPDLGGRPHEGRFDWSGPVISAGLKIRF